MFVSLINFKVVNEFKLHMNIMLLEATLHLYFSVFHPLKCS